MEGSPTRVDEALMAKKTIVEFLSLSADFVATGSNLNLGDATFELKPALIMMWTSQLWTLVQVKMLHIKVNL